MKIYLDYNASTPLAPEVAEAIRPFLVDDFGNPSSGHWASVRAHQVVQDAREALALLVGAGSPDQIVFTSGGSESNNWAIKGVIAHAIRERGVRAPHIVTTAIEHPSVRNPCAYLASLGASVTEVPVDGHGLVNPNDVRDAMRSETVLVSVMHANNEVGTVQPLAEIARETRARDVLLHSDAAQSVGKCAVSVDALGVDLLTVAGHKLYAPKGVGALFVRAGVELDPLIHGGGHERGRRGGTENVLLVAGLGAAAKLAHSSPCEDHLAAMTRLLWARLKEVFDDGVTLIGHLQQRLPNTLNVGFVGKSGAALLERMPEVAASTGSACDTGQPTMSQVLTAMGVAPEIGLGAVRFSVGRETTRAEIEQAVELLRSSYEHA